MLLTIMKQYPVLYSIKLPILHWRYIIHTLARRNSFSSALSSLCKCCVTWPVVRSISSCSSYFSSTFSSFFSSFSSFFHRFILMRFCTANRTSLHNTSNPSAMSFVSASLIGCSLGNPASQDSNSWADNTHFLSEQWQWFTHWRHLLRTRYSKFDL